MITKAIILNRIINTNTYSVRVPFLESSINETGERVATVSSNASISGEYRVGDVVYVSFEDHKANKPVIIGKLYLGNDEPRGFGNFESLNVIDKVNLPTNTTVGGRSLFSLLNKIENMDLSESGGSVVTQEYTPFAIIVNALTNINGWYLSKFTATLTTISSYDAYLIKENNQKLSEQRATDYMEDMTGIRFLPKYDYNKPKNTYFLMVDGTVWKAQYDSTNGLVLYKMPNPFVTQADLSEIEDALDELDVGEGVQYVN